MNCNLTTISEPLSQKEIVQLLVDAIRAKDNGDFKLAARHLVTLAKAGYAEAQFFAGMCYLMENEDLHNQHPSALAYDEGRQFSIRYGKDAVKWFTLAARQGHAEAQTILGMMLEGRSGEAQLTLRSECGFVVSALPKDNEDEVK